MAAIGAMGTPETATPPPPPPTTSDQMSRSTWAADIKKLVVSELRAQRGIAVPLTAMNLTWFGKTAITTAFLGRHGELALASGTLGLTFANATGYSILSGLSAAMEPICGQAHGARNRTLLRKTLLMATIMLLLASLPIAILWVYVDRILVLLGQHRDIAAVAKRCLIQLLPDLAVMSFLCPLKAYLSAQGVTLPILFSSFIALALHVPINVLLSRAQGMEGVASSIWMTDLAVAVMLALYVAVTEQRKDPEDAKLEEADGGKWWQQSLAEWATLARLSVPCCLTSFLEWWVCEILLLLAGRLPEARRAVSVIAVVFNFDYLLYSVMLSLATSTSTRVSNELGADRPGAARKSAYVSLGLSVVVGLLGGVAMVTTRGEWGRLFSKEEEVVEGVKKMLPLMALVDAVCFPMTCCGGVMRGTARPWLGTFGSVGGFYLVALPLAVAFGFKLGLGLGGLLLGFLVGSVAGLTLLAVFLARIDWKEEAERAGNLTGRAPEESAA